MNRQLIFNRVRDHLLAQNKKAEERSELNEPGDNRMVCRYRVETQTGTLACAVGCLITDEVYEPDIEGGVIHYKWVKSAVQLSLGVQLTTKDIEFLADLQRIHDRYPVWEWPDQLRYTATTWELVP
jgi:hypothetical protein